MWLGVLCVHEKAFNLLAELITNVLNASARVKFAIFLGENKQIRFFLLGKQFIHCFDVTQKSIQHIYGGVFCPGRYCSEEKCVYIHTWKENDKSNNEYEKPSLFSRKIFRQTQSGTR